jgi:hypothetical protein
MDGAKTIGPRFLPTRANNDDPVNLTKREKKKLAKVKCWSLDDAKNIHVNP